MNAVDRHEPAAGLLVRRVQRDRQAHPAALPEREHLRHQPRGGDGHALGRKPKPDPAVGDDGERPHERLEVGERLPHAHEDEIGQPLRVRQSVFDVADLPENLALGEIARELALGRQAEAAVLGAAHLARHAQRVMVALGDQDGFDALPVLQPEEEFTGPVRRGLLGPDLQPRNAEMPLKEGAHLLGEVRDLDKVICLAVIDPLEDLPRPIGGDPAFGQPRRELLPRQVEQIDGLIHMAFRILDAVRSSIRLAGCCGAHP